MRRMYFTLAIPLLLSLAACAYAPLAFQRSTAIPAGARDGVAPAPVAAGAPNTIVLAQDQLRPRTVTATGEAEVRVVPDEVILTLGVETWNQSLNLAKQENDQVVQRLLAVARKHGVEDKHIQTDYVSVEPRYRDGYEKRDFIGYFVRKSVVITLRDISRFEDLLSAALGAGANHVHGVQFRTTALRRHRDEARALAIKAAQEKATALAAELEQRVGEPLMIREDRNDWWSGYGAWWGGRWGAGLSQNVIQDSGQSTLAGDSGLAPGQIAVSAMVTVEFRLQ